MKRLPTDSAFFQCLCELDLALVVRLKARRCPCCGGPLDTANFPRKPRGLWEGPALRFSLCCRQEGCRHRLTPPSLRFLGRKVYVGWVVIMGVDFHNDIGLSSPLCHRTLSRWKSFWRENLADISPFMRWVRAHGLLPPSFMPTESPRGILGAIGFPGESSWIPALKLFTQYPAG
jgi:hypothetical protein